MDRRRTLSWRVAETQPGGVSKRSHFPSAKFTEATAGGTFDLWLEEKSFDSAVKVFFWVRSFICVCLWGNGL